MSSGKKCPKCRLVNPSSAQVCDCGYNFVSGRTTGSNWFARHLNFTAALTWLLYVPTAWAFFFAAVSSFDRATSIPTSAQAVVLQVAWLAPYLLWIVPTNAWILGKKNRSLWWVLRGTAVALEFR